MENAGYVKRQLTCKLTEAEIATAAMMAASRPAEYDTVEDEKKLVVGRFTDRLKMLRGEMTRQSKAATTGIVERVVECVWRINRAGGYAELFRLDTDECLERRKLTPREMQLSMDDVVKALMERSDAPDPLGLKDDEEAE